MLPEHPGEIIIGSLLCPSPQSSPQRGEEAIFQPSPPRSDEMACQPSPLRGEG